VISAEEVASALEGVIDPELGLDVVSLGMVRDVTVEAGRVTVGLTLTTATCPFWELFVEQVRIAVRSLPGSGEVDVHYVQHPAWDPELMTPEARCYVDEHGFLPISRRGTTIRAPATVLEQGGASSTRPREPSQEDRR
jgi:metal-sulfur cluster biosynthetic enzyme